MAKITESDFLGKSNRECLLSLELHSLVFHCSPPLHNLHIHHTLSVSLCSGLLSILLLSTRLQSSSHSAGNAGNRLKWREQQQLMVQVEAIFHQIRLTVSLIVTLSCLLTWILSISTLHWFLAIFCYLLKHSFP